MLPPGRRGDPTLRVGESLPVKLLRADNFHDDPRRSVFSHI